MKRFISVLWVTLLPLPAIGSGPASSQPSRTSVANDVYADSASWIAAHFEPGRASWLTSGYSKAFDGARSHIWWATGNFAQFTDFSYIVSPSAIPPPIADVGFESLFPHPKDQLKIENFRISLESADPKHGPPSWVGSFIYLDGRFRWLGGTYRFWAEGLNALRGPMSLPPAATVRSASACQPREAVRFQSTRIGPFL